MSDQLFSGQGRDINVQAGQSLAVSSIRGAYTATIVAGSGSGTALATDSTGGATYGPYSSGVTIRLRAGEGALLDYAAAVSPALNYGEAVRAGHDAAGDVASLVDGVGNAYTLSEATPIVTITGSGIAFTGTNMFRGIKVRAISGGPQTATVYAALSATGTPIDTIVFNALGTWYWDRETDTPSGGNGGRRITGTGIYIAFSGGTSRTVDVMVE